MAHKAYEYKNDRKGRQFELYSPWLSTEGELRLDLDTVIRFGNKNAEAALNYKCIAIVVLGFGIAYAWWTPHHKMIEYLDKLEEDKIHDEELDLWEQGRDFEEWALNHGQVE